MKDLVLEQLQSLSGTFRVLHGRVREAVAGEVGKAVSEAVAQVLTTALGGGLLRVPRYPQRPSTYGHPRPEWEEAEADRWDEEDEGYTGSRPGSRSDRGEATTREAMSPEAALALAWTAGRWWLGRRGSTWGAAGVALAAGGALVTGGPVIRTTLGVLWTLHRLMATTEAIGAGAKALDRL